MAPAEPPMFGNRRRPGHQSCLACKAVKLRCVRESKEAPCERCIEKGEACVMPEKAQRKPRRGNRLELAASLYGPSREASTSTAAGSSFNSSIITSRELSSEEELSISTPAVQEEALAGDHLSETSAENSLARGETYGWLSSHLIEEYFVASQYPLPVGSWKDFRAQFEQAGRRPTQLKSPMSEVMASLLMASGALVTNAPAILGSDIASSGGSNLRGYELRQWGRTRARACETLAEQAVLLADKRGVLRKESAESVSLLLMFSMLLDHGDPQRRRGRPYRVAAVGHARAIAEDRYPPSDYKFIVHGALGWMIYLVDTWSSASASSLPALTEADISVVCPMLRMELGLPNLDNISSALNGADVWSPVRRMWAYAAALMRQLIPFLRQDLYSIAVPGSDGPITVIGQVYKDLDKYKKCYTSFQSILAQFFTFRRPGYGLLRYYSAMTPLGSILITFYIDRALKSFMESALATDSLQELQWLGLSELYVESTRRMAECAREVARMFQAIDSLLPSKGAIALVPGIPSVYETLPIWADIVSSLPTQEDGYLTTYTLQEKRDELGWVLNALYSLGWAYADEPLNEAINCVERKLLELSTS